MRIARKIVAAGLLGMAEGHADGIEPALLHRPNAYPVLGQVFVDFRVFDRLHFEADHRRTVGLLLGRQDFDSGDLLQAPVKPLRFSGELSIIWPLTAVWRGCYIVLRKLGRSVDPQREKMALAAKRKFFSQKVRNRLISQNLLSIINAIINT